MRTMLVAGLGICAMALAACGDVELADANWSTAPLWTISNGTASLVIPTQVSSESEGVLRVDNHHLSYSITYDQDLSRETPSGLDWNFSEHQQGAVDSVLHYSDNDRTEHFLPSAR
jgi:hypothetical protein